MSSCAYPSPLGPAAAAKVNSCHEELDYCHIFNSLDIPLAVVKPDDQFLVVATNQAFAEATSLKIQDIKNHGLVESVYSGCGDLSGLVKDSLIKVKELGLVDVSPIHKYQFHYEEHYWGSSNTPIFHKDSRDVQYIIHRLEDVTEVFLARSNETTGNVSVAGQPQWNDSSKSPITAAQMRWIDSISNIVDIERKYMFMIENMPTIVFTASASGHICYANKSWYDYTGMTSDLADGWAQYLHPDDSKYAAMWKECIRSGDQWHHCYRFRSKEGTYRWFMVKAEPMRSADGKIIKWFGTCTDIDDQKRWEEERIENQKLIQLERETESELQRKNLETFIETICHEIRNPLNGIFGTIEFIREEIQSIEQELTELSPDHNKQDNSNAQLAQHLETITSNLECLVTCAEHQKVITNDVLSLSKLEAKKLELESFPFMVVELIQSAVGMFSSQLAAKNICLTKNIALDPSLIVLGDSHKLLQVVVNLISNAVKFTPKGGTIMLTVDERRSSSPHIISHCNDQVELVFSVKDSGIGMTEEEQQRIFDRFSQANKMVTSQYGGSGLGLSICRNLVQLMGGDITVQSQISKGSTFTFNVRLERHSHPSDSPLDHQDDTSVDQPRKRKIGEISIDLTIPRPCQRDPNNCIINAQQDNKKKTVLIAEDNIINQRILSTYLLKLGYDVEVTSNGLECLQKLRQRHRRYDIIFMDMAMPVMDGAKATKGIREEEKLRGCHHPIPIIGTSGNIRDEQRNRALSAGMNDYLTKPYDKDTINKTVVYWTSRMPTFESVA